MGGFPILLLLLVLQVVLSSFGACDWLLRVRKQEVDGGREAQFKGLWSQHLQEVLAQKDPGPLWSSGAPRRLLLYCPVGIGLHLQIPPGGVVRGVHVPDKSCWLRVFSVKPGVVGIQGEKSKLFLCMSESGRVYTQEIFSEQCHLRETVEENHYNTYSSALHHRVYLGLSRHGHVKKGTSVHPHQPHAHFLPRRTLLT